MRRSSPPMITTCKTLCVFVYSWLRLRTCVFIAVWEISLHVCFNAFACSEYFHHVCVCSLCPSLGGKISRCWWLPVKSMGTSGEYNPREKDIYAPNRFLSSHSLCVSPLPSCCPSIHLHDVHLCLLIRQMLQYLLALASFSHLSTFVE